MLSPEVTTRLTDVLTESQHRGFLGPGPIASQIEHSLGFTALASDEPTRALDLGSGGGLPGLVLAMAWPETSWVLLDGSSKRTEFLIEAVALLDLSHRVSVVTERAEMAGRGDLRASQDLVVARGFGPPAVTAECSAPLLRVGGILAVAEPPGGAPGRWPAPELDVLGLVPVTHWSEPVALQLLRQAAPCPDRYPRRVGIPSKRPLFAR